MAKTLPPGFAGIDFTQYAQWPVVIVDGLPYRQIPGLGQYLYDEYDGPTGSIKINPKHVEKAIEEEGPKEPGVVESIAPAAGLIGGLYGAKKIGGLLEGGEVAAETTKQVGESILGNSVEVAGAADTTGIATQAGEGILGASPQYGSFAGPGVGEAAAAPGMFSLEGIGGAGNAILPIAGTLGAIDLFGNKRSGGRGALQGAASGAAIGSYFGLPGAAIGAGIGGLGGFFGNFGDEDRFKTEGNRLQKLKEQGVNVPQSILDSMPSRGRSKEELIALENSRPDGNALFAGSRKESDLRPQDIVGYATFAENDPKWFEKPLEEQLKVADQALKAGAVREHHGTIDVDFSKLNQTSTKEEKKPSGFAQTVGGALQRPTFSAWGR